MTKKSSTVNTRIKNSGKQKSQRTNKKATMRRSARQTVSLSKAKINELLTQARDLAWAGQHAKAIELCTQALDAIGVGNSRTAQIQMDLLDLRAESNDALLNIDALQTDAKIMMRIANAAPSSPKGKKLELKMKRLSQLVFCEI